MIRAGAGTANVTIDGGIIRAIADNSTFFHSFADRHVQLGSNGGHFDTNDHDIGVSTALAGPAALITDGSGTLTLKRTNRRTGLSPAASGTCTRLGRPIR